MKKEAKIVKAALAAATIADASDVQKMIEGAIGARYERPVADKWKNEGSLKGSGGSNDLKLIEIVTNMQDAYLELKAVEKHGSMNAVPYDSPHEAATALFGNPIPKTVADDLIVEFRESDPPTRKTKRLTAVFRDRARGMAPVEVPLTILIGGASSKEEFKWLQGAFGMGGATTFAQSAAAVVVTRKQPTLLESGEDDRITVAVVEWVAHTKVRSAFYLVDREWDRGLDEAVPFSIPATEFPGFEPGTHLALISYPVEGIHRAKLGDERSFDTIVNTRLFRPVLPIKFKNPTRNRWENLTGLQRRLRDNPRASRPEGTDTIPFRNNGTTYHLPIKYWVFSKPGEEGSRRRFVAKDHAVVFTSNGQCHLHWTPDQFRTKFKKIPKLYDRILVVIETDEIPIDVRTWLFTADRQHLVRTPAGIRLENEVQAFIESLDELKDIQKELVLEAIAGSSGSGPDSAISKQISSMLKVRGFSSGASGTSSGGGGGRHTRRLPPEKLYLDPTTLEGPERATAVVGETKFLTFILNAQDNFIPVRGTLDVSCDNPDITSREITIGSLSSGRIRVSIAVPEDAQLGECTVTASVGSWLRSSGGLGKKLTWQTTLDLVSDQPVSKPAKKGAGKSGGKSGVKEGSQVALVWQQLPHVGWDKSTVGDVEKVAASDLAGSYPEYEELKELGDVKIPTIVLNEDYALLKRYTAERSKSVSEATIKNAKDRYAVGVGVGLVLMDKVVEDMRKNGAKVDDKSEFGIKIAVAKSTLSMMPAIDGLIREAGLDQ